MLSAHVVSKSSARVILVSMKCGEERASPKTVLMLTPCLRGERLRTEHQRRQLTNILSLFTALPERGVTVHSGDMGYTIGPFAGSAKCPGRCVNPWTND